MKAEVTMSKGGDDDKKEYARLMHDFVILLLLSSISARLNHAENSL